MGENSALIPVSILGNALYEKNKSFKIYVIEGKAEVSAGAAFSATAVLVNDDLPPTLTISDASIEEAKLEQKR